MINGITHENQGFDVRNLPLNKVKNMSEVYICPSFLCNLNCPHCTLKNLPQQLELARIEETLDYINENSGDMVLYDLFGGEPLLLPIFYLRRLHKRLIKKHYLVSTNLLNYNQEHLFLFKDADLINTSWNPHRFNKDQFTLWLDNYKKVWYEKIPINLMVTLTEDLIKECPPEKFLDLLRALQPYSLDLDYVIGKDNTSLEDIDNWLCELYHNWTDLETHFGIVENMEKSLLYGFKYKDCSNHYTILPSGNIKPGCAYYECDVDKSICYACELFPWCNGACRLQSKCTFPKKLFNLVKEKICNQN